MKQVVWKEALKDFKSRLEKKYEDNLANLILFGSTARGEWDDGSDIDVLVVLHDFEDFWQEFHTVIDIAYLVSMNTDFQVLISPVLSKESEYKNAKDILLLNIKREGVTV